MAEIADIIQVKTNGNPMGEPWVLFPDGGCYQTQENYYRKTTPQLAADEIMRKTKADDINWEQFFRNFPQLFGGAVRFLVDNNRAELIAIRTIANNGSCFGFIAPHVGISLSEYTVWHCSNKLFCGGIDVAEKDALLNIWPTLLKWVKAFYHGSDDDPDAAICICSSRDIFNYGCPTARGERCKSK